MAIDIARRRDLDARAEKSAARLDLPGRARKTAVIERALRATGEQTERARPDRASVEAALERLAAAGDRFREREGRRRSAAADRALSQVWQDELYDEHGLPE